MLKMMKIVMMKMWHTKRMRKQHKHVECDEQIKRNVLGLEDKDDEDILEMMSCVT